MAEPIVFSGTVDWSGENPGISLKERPDGPFTALASFFRVVLSPHGRGHVLVLLCSPAERRPAGERVNLCLSDNAPLARFLVSGFVSHFGAFRGLPGLEGIEYRALDRVVSEGNAATRYSETVTAGGLTARLAWDGLGKPFCFAMPPEKSPTGHHHLVSLFVPCEKAGIIVNDRELPGVPVPREMAGRKMSTAMLAFSETWIRA